MSEVAKTYIVETIKSLKGLKSTSEKAIAQITGEEMHFQTDNESNCVAILMKHMAGNMLSRFTDFLTSDGEKVWRERDNEFIDENLSREKLFEIWNNGWDQLFKTLSGLKEDDLLRNVMIRGENHTVLRALQRQLVHYSYHTGQIVYICKQIRKSDFNSLSIPKKPAEKSASK